MITHHQSVCTECGTEIPEESPGSHCPRCLFELALTPDPSPARRPRNLSAGVAAGARQLEYFAGHEILSEIARGGMGVVYHARQIDPPREVALKVLQTGALATPDARLRFEMEISAVTQLSHPNIISLYEAGTEDGIPFFSMNHLPGGNLADRLKREPVPVGESQLRERVRFLKSVSDAIHHAHQRGILHRDLKPSNIVFDENGHPVVTDFGLVKLLESDSNLTLSQAVIGSPNYMAPEQASGDAANLTTAADIYGLGAILYECITGHPPFQADTPVETMRLVIDQAPRAPRRLNETIDKDLERVCLKCLEKNPAQRYASAEDFSEDLHRWLERRPVHARRTSSLVQAWSWCRRHPGLAAAVTACAALLTLITIGAVFAAYRIDSANKQTSDLLVKMQREKAESLIASDRVRDGLAMLAHIVRQRPEDTNISRRLYSELTTRRFATPAKTLRRHAPQCNAVAIANDREDTAVTLSLDGSAYRWDLAAPPNARPQSLFSLGEYIREGAVAADCRSVFAYSSDGSLTLWTDRGAAPETLSLGSAQRCHRPAFDPSGRYLLAIMETRILRVWDTEKKGAVVREFEHDGPLLSWATALDHHFTVTSTTQGTLTLWDAWENKRVHTQNTHRDISHITFNRKGDQIATGTAGGALCVWDLSSWKCTKMRSSHNAPITHLEFNRNGTMLVSASFDGTARIWDSKTGEELTPPLKHTDFVFAAHFSKDGRRVATASEDSTARLWDTTTGRPLTQPLLHNSGLKDVFFRRDSAHLTTTTFSGFIRDWNVRTPFSQPIVFESSRNMVKTVFLSPIRMAGGGRHGHVSLWDVTDGSCITIQKTEDGKIGDLTTTKNRAYFATAGSKGHARVFDATTGAPASLPLSHPDAVYACAFSPDGAQLLTGCRDGAARLWDWRNATLLSETPSGGDTLRFATFSEDGSLFLTATQTKVCVWHTISGKEAIPAIRHASAIHSAAFFDDGKTVTLTGARKVHLHSLAAPAAPLEFLHPSQITSTQFTNAGKALLTGCSDGHAYLWDTSRPASPVRSYALGSGVHIARFSNDASMILTASAEGSLRIWDKESGAPITGVSYYEKRISGAAFTPDDTAIVLTFRDSDTLLVPIPPVIDDAASWLPQLAEVVAKTQMHRDGGTHTIPSKNYLELRNRAEDGSTKTQGAPLTEHLLTRQTQ